MIVSDDFMQGLKNDKISEQDVDVLLQFAQEDQIDSLRVGKKTLIAVETILKNNENKSDTSLKTSHQPIRIRFSVFFTQEAPQCWTKSDNAVSGTQKESNLERHDGGLGHRDPGESQQVTGKAGQLSGGFKLSGIRNR